MAIRRLSDDEVLAQIPAARRRARNTSTCAQSVRYLARSGSLRIDLVSGATLLIPVELIASLRDVSEADLKQVRLGAAGMSLRWERLDEDLSIAGLARLALGHRMLMSAAGAAGGSVRSAAKAQASRDNGRKGGRPRQRPDGG